MQRVVSSAYGSAMFLKSPAVLQLNAAVCRRSLTILHRNPTGLGSLTSVRLIQNRSERRHLATTSLPSSSEIVIAGGGIIGCSVAYHLAKYGKKNVLLLEQGRFGGGTTWHSVGLCSPFRRTYQSAMMAIYATQLYESLEEETGLTAGYKKCGNILLAQCRDRAAVLRRSVDRLRQWGHFCEEITSERVKELCPLIRTDDIVMAIHSPSDGVVNANDALQSLLRGATMKGVKAREGVSVLNVKTENNAVVGVETDQGFISCEKFINCGGQWARDLGLKSSPQVDIPLHSIEHFYIVTKPNDDQPINSMMPAVRDHDGRIYIREWSGGLMAGGFELDAKPCFYEGIPDNFTYQLLEENWDQFGVLMDAIVNRVPGIESLEIRQFVNGPESFTPDANMLVGEAAAVKNYFVAAGLSSYGMTLGPGTGRHIAELICDQKTTLNLSESDTNRFHSDCNNKLFLMERAKEGGVGYSIGYPLEEMRYGRRMKCSPLHGALQDQGAIWNTNHQWETAMYFTEDVNAQPRLSLGTPSWLSDVHRELSLCQAKVGLTDLTHLSKFEVTAQSQSTLINGMQALFAVDINVKSGGVVTSAILDHNGFYRAVADLVRLDTNRYLITVTPDQHTVVKAALSSMSNVSCRDVSGAYSCLAVTGPQSSAAMIPIAQHTMLDDFPDNTAKVMDFAFASDVIVTRGSDQTVTDWKLFIPSEYTVGVYENLMKSGKENSIGAVGQLALDYHRISKQIPQFKIDYDRSARPIELQYCPGVPSIKAQDFVGKDATIEHGKSESEKRLCVFQVKHADPSQWPWGSEPILRDGDYAGTVSSCSYDFKTQTPLVMAFVTSHPLKKSSEYEILISGQRFVLESL